MDILELLGDKATVERLPKYQVMTASAITRQQYLSLRRKVFVVEQGLFEDSDLDEIDLDKRTIVLVAVDRHGSVIGGVRLSPMLPNLCGDTWWAGSRLVVEDQFRGGYNVGTSLVRAACAAVEAEGALRFEATVQEQNVAFFEELGWQPVAPTMLAGHRHFKMRWPINRLQNLALATKGLIGSLLEGLEPGGPGWVGDDAAPVPGSNLVAACDAILPSMAERDPEWAGWCSVLVNVNDITAMGADPIGLLDSISGPDFTFLSRVMTGIKKASIAYGIPILGGHTQLGVPAALSVTMLGRTESPIPSSGAEIGDFLHLTIDLHGSWRSGYRGNQWDSTTSRTPQELRTMMRSVTIAKPKAAKDVSMAGIVGTLGMMAEASGCSAELELIQIPRPSNVALGDWLTCFPGFGILSAESPGSPNKLAQAARPATSAKCGNFMPGKGVQLVWPDGARTEAISDGVTGLGSVDSGIPHFTYP